MLAYRLRDLRKKMRYKLKEVAEAVGVPTTTYAAWEYGKTTPPTEKLRKLSEFLGSSVDYLIVAVAEWFAFPEAKAEIGRLKQEKASVEHRISELNPKDPMNTDEVLLAFERLEEAFADQDPKEKRQQIRLFVRCLKYDPRDDSIRVRLWAEPTSPQAWAEYVLGPTGAKLWCPGPE